MKIVYTCLAWFAIAAIWGWTSGRAEAQTALPFALEPQPQWSAWAGAIFLARSNPGGTPLASTGVSLRSKFSLQSSAPVATPQLVQQGVGNGAADGELNADELSFNTQAGPDLNLLRRGETFDLDFRYFQVDQMTAGGAFAPGGSAVILLDSPLFVTCERFDVRYASNLLSAETNLRRNVGPFLSLLAGFRYVQLREGLGLEPDRFGQDAATPNVNVASLNNLYGFQIGADGTLLAAGGLRLLSGAKVGIYGNDAGTDMRLTNEGDPDVALLADRAQHVAFVGDWSFTGVIQISDNVALRAGYQLLWLSGVATASDQVPATSIDTGGDVFLHGALVGAEAGW